MIFADFFIPTHDFHLTLVTVLMYCGRYIIIQIPFLLNNVGTFAVVLIVIMKFLLQNE